MQNTHNWLRRGVLTLSSLALAVCLGGCPQDSASNTNGDGGGADGAAEAPPIEDQLQEAGIDSKAVEAEAAAEAETITAEDADAILSDLEADLAAEGE